MTTPAAKPYVEKPRKVQAAPYDPTADPPQPGVCTCATNPDVPGPHVHLGSADSTGMIRLAAGDMIIVDEGRPDQVSEVLTLAQFEARYGNVPGS